MDSVPGRFEFLPHTADAKFKAFGKTMEECFANAAVATFEIITETKKVKPKLQFNLTANSEKPDTLLFDFLDELLFLLDTEGFILCDARVTIRKDGDEYILTAIASGDYHKGYDVSCNVKAITYNDMYVKSPEETGSGWECQVVVDL